MRLRAVILGIVLVVVAVALTGCAAGPNDLKNYPDTGGSVAGFWLGLWHGFILSFSFLISFFSDKVTIYEVHNSGGWYNFGFFLGAGAILGGGSSTATRN